MTEPDTLEPLTTKPTAKRGLARLGDALSGSGGALARRRALGTVYLLIDCSSSMADGRKLEQARRGSLRFSVEAWRRSQAVGVIGFSGRPFCLVNARLWDEKLAERLGGLQADGRTAMAGAIRMATAKLRRRRGQRTIILITDGMPNSREATLAAAHFARASGIELVAIGTDGADEAFLASLTPKAELAVKVPRGALEESIYAAVGVLPKAS